MEKNLLSSLLLIELIQIPEFSTNSFYARRIQQCINSMRFCVNHAINWDINVRENIEIKSEIAMCYSDKSSMNSFMFFNPSPPFT
ncbi:hypothetical protein HZS_5430 [Henneguya salminicola]|nr:hypothetical protein HZS_5430 [Henneguya salminicola]